MRVSSDFLGGLLRPAAPKPKLPTARERAATNRLNVLRALAAHGHLRCSDLAAACWPQAAFGEQMAQRTVRVLVESGELKARRNAHGSLSYVLTRPGAAALELRGVAARHGLDLASVSGPTYAHFALTARWCLAKQAQGFEAYSEYALVNGFAPVTAQQLLGHYRKLCDAVLIRGKQLWLPEMSEAEREAALALLQSPELLARILADFEACDVVGERVNKLMGYLAATSRKLDRPLAVVIQSSSAAGKSSLMDAVLAFVPEEERVQFSALTGQALFYMGETNLQHKVLAISEEEGAHRASYALKLLQSEGELTIASTGTDAAGNLVTQQYKVCGPVMLFLTTTAIDIDEELMNRCLVLSVDEGREQTAAIHRQQRLGRTLDGLIAKERKREVLALHRNAQRLLRSLAVVNPYADQLTFLDDRTRTRREHGKYLALMDVLALLHPARLQARQGSETARVHPEPQTTAETLLQALEAEASGDALDA